MVAYPKDWKSSTLGEVGTFIKGAPFSKADISADGTPFILYGELYTTYGDVTYQVLRRTKRQAKAIHYSRVGDVIIPTSGETAEEISTASCIMIPGVILAGDLNIYRAKGFDGRFISRMIKHVLNSQISEVAQGISIIHLSAKDLGKIKFHYPSLKEQTAIADLIDSFDNYINNLSNLIEKKRNIRDGALEDLICGKTTISGFNNKRKEYKISDITRNIITGGTPSTTRQEYYGGNIPWLSSTEIHQKRITKPTTYITELGLQNSSAKIAPERSVLIALAGQGKTRGTAAYLTKPMALNQSLAALVTNEKCNPEFLYYLISNMYLPLRELSSGDGGRGGLNKKIIEKVSVTIPIDIAEQIAIANTLSAMDEEIEALKTEQEKMIQIREGAIEDLLTGHIRLSVKEENGGNC